MKKLLFVAVSLCSGALYASEQSTDRVNQPWKLWDKTRPWHHWCEKDKTWYEWRQGFNVKRIYQYADTICNWNKPEDNTKPISVMGTFEGFEKFEQDHDQRHWLNFCEKRTKNLLETPVDKQTPYQLEEFYDCCGAPIRKHAQRVPERYSNMIELVDAAEKVIIAQKALDAKIKSLKQQQ
jgi:hypothetical protein